MKYILVLLFASFQTILLAQLNTKKQKVLFVLDASGSMVADWDGKSRMEIAKGTLIHLVDSIEASNPNIEVGLRVFGHQFHKSLNNCTDSKLEIPFGEGNTTYFIERLKGVQANGNTPIAYSLIESANDFNDDDAINSIILITDGLENCEGNPCDAAKYLNEKRITINPFIIGLDIQDSLIHQFECIGTFINAKDEQGLKVILKNTVKKATGKTSLCINLLTIDGQTISNMPIEIFDPINKQTLYSYVHSISKKELPDTLFIDPRGKYQIKAHSFPPISSPSFFLTSGTHNNVDIVLPKSFLDIRHKKLYDDKQARVLIRINDKWVYNYYLDDLALLENNYQINTTLIPLKNEDEHLIANKVSIKKQAANGKLSIENYSSIRASIFSYGNSNWKLVYDLNKIDEDFTIKLQPGNYSLIYVLDHETNSDNTHRYDFTIFEERTTVIKLN